MKRRDLVRKIEEGGAIFIRHGGRHDWYQNPQGKRIKILAKIPVFPSGWPASPPLVLRSATGRLRRWPTA